jgi:hypothetical protein
MLLSSVAVVTGIVISISKQEYMFGYKAISISKQEYMFGYKTPVVAVRVFLIY